MTRECRDKFILELPESLFLAVILLFGAKKLPELARAIGRSLAEFKHAQKEGEKTLKEF